MKKIYLFLLITLISCPAWSQVGKLTLDMLVKRGMMSAARKGAQNAARAATKNLPSVTIKNIVTEIPTVTSAEAASAVVANTSIDALSDTTLAALQQPLNASLLAASTDLAQQIVRCGQSYVGFPQYDYLRNFYEKMSESLPSELVPTLSSYGSLMLERKYPGVPDADGIAENALEEVSEYIPSYNAVKDALEDAGQVNAIFANLEHQVELAYPSAQFEGAFVRTFRELEAVYAEGRINGLGGRDVRRAIEQADEQALKKDTGFFLVKVGEPGSELKDVLVLDISKLQWSSYKKTLEELPDMIEE